MIFPGEMEYRWAVLSILADIVAMISGMSPSIKSGRAQASADALQEYIDTIQKWAEEQLDCDQCEGVGDEQTQVSQGRS